jgi:predicted  nucleic acid-binding Zn-ribbon protein
MPHQCVRCGNLFDDGSDILMSGCSSCKGKLFFYVKKEKIEEMKNATAKLTKSDKKQIEDDIFEIIGETESSEEPVVLDFESIRVLKPGKYELDLVNLFKGNPVIYKLDEGKYMIDLPETFKKILPKKETKKTVKKK